MRAFVLAITVGLALAAAPASAESPAFTGKDVRSTLNGLGYEVNYSSVHVPAKGDLVAAMIDDGKHRFGLLVNARAGRYMPQLKKSVPGESGRVFVEGITGPGPRNELRIYERITRGNTKLWAKVTGALCKAVLGEPCGP